MTGERSRRAGWLLLMTAAAIASAWADSGPSRLNSAILAATWITIVWYTIETRNLRVEQEHLRRQQDADSEIRNHPWLRATDLKPEMCRDSKLGLFGELRAYLPITNCGLTPAFDLIVKTEWAHAAGEDRADGSTEHRQIVLSPGDTAHVLLCDIPILVPGGRISIGTLITYRTLTGGRGQFQVTFNEEPGGGFSNGPSEYTVKTKDGQVLPGLT